MQIGPKRFKSTVGFSDKLGVGFHLLGRQDVFPHFRIFFTNTSGWFPFSPARMVRKARVTQNALTVEQRAARVGKG
jgi:hypothetical protein